MPIRKPSDLMGSTQPQPQRSGGAGLKKPSDLMRPSDVMGQQQGQAVDMSDGEAVEAMMRRSLSSAGFDPNEVDIEYAPGSSGAPPLDEYVEAAGGQAGRRMERLFEEAEQAGQQMRGVLEDQFVEDRYSELGQAALASGQVSDDLSPLEAGQRVRADLPASRQSEVDEQFAGDFSQSLERRKERARQQEELKPVMDFIERRERLGQALFDEYMEGNPDAQFRDAMGHVQMELDKLGYQPQGAGKLPPLVYRDGNVESEYIPAISELYNLASGIVRGSGRVTYDPANLALGIGENIERAMGGPGASVNPTTLGQMRTRTGEAQGRLEEAAEGYDVPYNFDVAGLVGEQIPQIVTTVAGANVARGAGLSEKLATKLGTTGQRIAGNSFALGQMFAMEGGASYDEYYQAALDAGMTDDEASQAALGGALVYGVASAALERVGPFEALMRAPKSRSALVRWALGTGSEAGTEGSQSLTQSFIEAGINPDQDWAQNVRDAIQEAAAGAIVGGAVTTGQARQGAQQQRASDAVQQSLLQQIEERVGAGEATPEMRQAVVDQIIARVEAGEITEVSEITQAADIAVQEIERVLAGQQGAGTDQATPDQATQATPDADVSAAQQPGTLGTESTGELTASQPPQASTPITAADAAAQDALEPGAEVEFDVEGEQRPGVVVGKTQDGRGLMIRDDLTNEIHEVGGRSEITPTRASEQPVQPAQPQPEASPAQAPAAAQQPTQAQQRATPAQTQADPEVQGAFEQVQQQDPDARMIEDESELSASEQVAANFARERGLKVGFIDSGKVSGGSSGNVVMLRKGMGDRALWETVAHEVAHGTGLDQITDVASKRLLREAEQRYMTERAPTFGPEYVQKLKQDPGQRRREGVAMLVGELLADPQYRRKLRNEQPNLWQRIGELVRAPLEALSGRSAAARRVLQEFQEGVAAPRQQEAVPAQQESALKTPEPTSPAEPAPQAAAPATDATAEVDPLEGMNYMQLRAEAKRRGVDIADIKGEGATARIRERLREQPQEAAEQPAESPQPAKAQQGPLARVRQQEPTQAQRDRAEQRAAPTAGQSRVVRVEQIRREAEAGRTAEEQARIEAEEQRAQQRQAQRQQQQAPQTSAEITSLYSNAVANMLTADQEAQAKAVRADQKHWIDRAKEGDADAQLALVAINMGGIRNIAKEFAGDRDIVEDLVSEGVRAAEQWMNGKTRRPKGMSETEWSKHPAHGKTQLQVFEGGRVWQAMAKPVRSAIQKEFQRLVGGAKIGDAGIERSTTPQPAGDDGPQMLSLTEMADTARVNDLSEMAEYGEVVERINEMLAEGADKTAIAQRLAEMGGGKPDEVRAMLDMMFLPTPSKTPDDLAENPTPQDINSMKRDVRRIDRDNQRGPAPPPDHHLLLRGLLSPDGNMQVWGAPITSEVLHLDMIPGGLSAKLGWVPFEVWGDGSIYIAPTAGYMKGSPESMAKALNKSPAFRQAFGENAEALINEMYWLPEKQTKAGTKFDPEQFRKRFAAALLEQPKVTGQPRLANISNKEVVRRLADVVDQLRAEQNMPQVRPDKVVQSEARNIIKDKQAKASLVKKINAGVELNDAETAAAKDLISTEALAAVQTNTPSAIERAIRLVDGYRQGGSEQARAFRQRADRFKSPEMRWREFLASAVLSPPKVVRDKIDKKRKVVNDADATPEERGKAQEEIDKQLRLWAEKYQRMRDRLLKMGVDLDQIRPEDWDVKTGKGLKLVYTVIREAQIAKADAGDMLYEFWISGLLSFPLTNIVNISGNTINALAESLVSRPIQATINELSGRRIEGAPTWAEWRSIKRGLGSALGHATRNFSLAWSVENNIFERETGHTGEDKLDLSHAHAIPGFFGKAVRSGFYIGGGPRLLRAVDEFFKTLIGHVEVYAQADRIARQEGHNGAALDSRVDALIADHNSRAWHNSIDEARRLTFMADLGEFGEWILSGRRITRDMTRRLAGPEVQASSGVGRAAAGTVNVAKRAVAAPLDLHYHVPFVTTLVNIFKQGLSHTPLGSIKLMHQIARKGYDGLVRSQPSDIKGKHILRSVAEQTVAYATLAAIIKATDADDDELPWITGTEPYSLANRSKRELAYATMPPTSFRVPGTNMTLNYGRMEPVATALSFTVDAVNTFRDVQQGADASEAVGRVLRQSIEQMKNKTFAEGITRAIQAMESDRGASIWYRDFLVSFMPNVIRGGARSTDPFIRETSVGAQTWGEYAAEQWKRTKQLMLPLPSNAPPPRVDWLGQDVTKGEGGAVERTLNPMQRRSLDRASKWSLFIRRWNEKNPRDEWAPGRMRRYTTFSGLGEGGRDFRHDYTDEQYYRVQKLAGETTVLLLDNSGFDPNKEPTREDIEAIQEMIRASRDYARGVLVTSGEIEFPDMSQQQ